MSQKKVLFLHYNFPAQFGSYLSFFHDRNWHLSFAFCESKSLHTKINFKVDKYNLSHPAKRPSPNLQASLEVSEIYLDFFLKLKKSGYSPDVIISHSGWGCGFYAKHIFPDTILISYSEWFHSVDHILSLSQCDPVSFPRPVTADYKKIPTRNLLSTQELLLADLVITPTKYQQSQLPSLIGSKSILLRDAVFIPPSPSYKYSKPANITFVSRGIEPIRGSTFLMNLLPHLTNTDIIKHFSIVGASSSFYGSPKSSSQDISSLSTIPASTSLRYFQQLTFPKLLDLFSHSTLHLYLSLPFVPSWSMLNAMSLGVPVLTLDLDYLSEFFPSSRLRISSKLSPADQANQILSYLSDEHHLKAASSCNREYITSNHSYNVFSATLKSLLLK